MTDKLAVALVQPDLIWEDIDANLEMLDEMAGKIVRGTDLILLPETFSSGFTMRAGSFAEGEGGKAVGWMKQLAGRMQCHVTGSVIIREDGRIFNRLFWVSSEGIRGRYDKRHLFRMGRENRYFQAGSERPVFSTGNARCMPQICYDIRFPVFARNRNDYDILIYVANWPARRQHVWDILLQARAIENQAYVLGVNRTGTDGEGVLHQGGSCAVDPKGHRLAALGGEPGVLHFELDLGALKEFRNSFPAWKDADPFTLGD